MKDFKELREGAGLWANIRAKKARGEKMRAKGEEGAPTPDAIKQARGESVSEQDTRCCKYCGDEFGKPTNEKCMYDAYDQYGENWVKKEMYEGLDITEISLNMLRKKISNTNLGNTRKAMKTDKIKADLAKMRDKLNKDKGMKPIKAQYESLEIEEDARLKSAGVSGYNKPKRTPSHPKKSHIVVAKEGDKVKTIRFGQQGASTAGDPKKGESDKMKKKRASFKARHGKNIAKGKMSAAYWADKEKW